MESDNVLTLQFEGLTLTNYPKDPQIVPSFLMIAVNFARTKKFQQSGIRLLNKHFWEKQAAKCQASAYNEADEEAKAAAGAGAEAAEGAGPGGARQGLLQLGCGYLGERGLNYNLDTTQYMDDQYPKIYPK